MSSRSFLFKPGLIFGQNPSLPAGTRWRDAQLAASLRASQVEPGPEPPSYHLTPDQLRAQGQQVLDWVARYHETVEQHPVRSTMARVWRRVVSPEEAPTSSMWVAAAWK